MSDYEFRQAAMQHFGITQASRMTIDQIKHWYNNHMAKSDEHVPTLSVLTQKVG